MRALLQRVTEAAVLIDDDPVAEIGPGLLILLGVAPRDTVADADWLAAKALGLRIFPDAAKPMNLSVMDIGGEVLAVSQFTLAADTSRGKRPSFTSAASPEIARALYEAFLGRLRQRWHRVQAGRFGAEMRIRLVNDGPVTFLLERP